MPFKEVLRSALLEIRAHKGRSALTCASLSFGVAAMLYTFAQIKSIQDRFHKAIELAGPGRLFISQKQGYTSRGLSQGLTSEDAAALRAAFPEFHMVYPSVGRSNLHIEAPGGFRNDDADLRAVTPDWSKRDWVYTLRGRFLNSADVAAAARTCVVIEPGGWIKKPYWAKYWKDSAFESYLSRHDLLGRSLVIEGHLFSVVGVLRSPPRDKDPRWFRFGGADILVPISTYEKFLARKSWGRKSASQVDMIQLDTGRAEGFERDVRRVEALLKARHRGEKDFEIKDFPQMVKGAITSIRKYALTILAIGLVAVLASGIGIMNVTLATIFSRVREIGIRRSIGATRRDIVWQFVSEAMTLGLLAGLAGTALGIAAIYFLSPRSERMLSSLSPLHALGALLLSMGTGFLFSIGPAYKASRYDPVEALRYE